MHYPTTVSLRNLRIFAHAADLQNLRRTAEVLSMSQPAVTQAITRLEEELDCQLFDRNSAGSLMRPEGRVLARRTELMFQQIEAALGEFGVPVRRADTATYQITRSQIRALTEIARSISFADAARKAGLSTVALHRAARDLERNLGKQVFVAGQSGFVATRNAEQLARRLAVALREIDWAVDEIAQVRGHRGGTLRLGAMPLAGGFLLGRALDEIMRHYPAMHAVVHTADARELTTRLRRGDLDIVVGMNRPQLETDDVVQEPMVFSPFVVIARRDHPLTRKTEVSLDDLSEFDWIAPTFGSTRRGVFNSLFARMSKPPIPKVETNSLTTIRTLMSVSDRLTMITRFEFEFEHGVADFQILPFEQITEGNAIGVIQRRNWQPTALHLKFLDILRQQTT